MENDLRRFIDGSIKKQIEEAKSDLLMWIMTYEIIQSGAFTKRLQLRMGQLFDDDTMDRLRLFVGGLTRSEGDSVIYEKVRSSRARLESLIPQTFEYEVNEIQSKIATLLEKGGSQETLYIVRAVQRHN